MNQRYFTASHRLALLAIVALLGAALTGCETTEEVRRANLEQDTDTCADFGSRYGSAEHSACMLAQQERRETETLNALERQHLSSEIAKNNVEMLERRRCEREAKQDRKEGRRPRSCR